jgi:hypothetical protein
VQIKTTLRFHLTLLESHHHKHHQQQVLARMWGKRNPLTLLVEVQASATTLENNMEAS